MREFGTQQQSAHVRPTNKTQHHTRQIWIKNFLNTFFKLETRGWPSSMLEKDWRAAEKREEWRCSVWKPALSHRRRLGLESRRNFSLFSTSWLVFFFGESCLGEASFLRFSHVLKVKWSDIIWLSLYGMWDEIDFERLWRRTSRWDLHCCDDDAACD